MAFFSRAGKKSGVCRHCNSLPDHYGECKCSMGKGMAECTGCGAKGPIPNTRETPERSRLRIGCSCSSLGEKGAYIVDRFPSKPETMRDSDVSGHIE
jgi:hypothetical protein